MFKPTGCLGNDPAIGRTDPILERIMMKCSRGILTGQPQLRRQCYITITKVRDMINTVQEISLGALQLMGRQFPSFVLTRQRNGYP